MVKSSADSLLIILNDVLDYSKIEAGRVTLDPVPFDPAELVRSSVRSLAVTAQNRGLKLAIQVDPSIPSRLIGDPGRLRQVIVNLVGNAIKFTSRGGVTVRVDLQEVTAAGPRLHFAVQDTGIGIPREKQERIFQAFEQADTSTTRQYGGTGLGLAICWQIVHLMGGTIWVESGDREGSIFHFTVQLANPQVELGGEAKAPCPTKASAVPCRSEAGTRIHGGAPSTALSVLVVEDNPVNQMVAVTILQKLGHHVEVAENGAEGFQKWKAGAFDVIFMDMQMPGVDGYESTRCIRSHEEEVGGHVYIASMTAHVMDGDRERCLAAGMDDYVSKPLSQAGLLRVLSAATKRVPGV
jgi:CheY-like chemotaxis protein